MTDKTLALALELVLFFEARGTPAAIVGATALALHGYARATSDIDIGITLTSLAAVKALGDDVARAYPALTVDVSLPDHEDPLGGVITLTGPGIRQVQLINFINRIGVGEHPGREGVQKPEAVSVAGHDTHVVDLEHLVAMKLYAGGMKSKADVVELMKKNPDADLSRIESLCARFHLDDEWRALLPEIESDRA